MADRNIWVRNETYNSTRAAAQEAARRKREADAKARRAKEKLRAVERETARTLERTNRELGERITSETNRMLQGLDHISEDLDRQLQDHICQTESELNTLRTSIGEVEGQAHALDLKIDNLASEMSSRFQAMADALKEEEARAQLYCNQFQVILSRIHTLHPDKLTPGVVTQEMEPVSGFLEADMGNGDYQAAIAVAQTKIPEAMALQSRLEALNIEYAALRSQMRELSGQLRSRVRALQDSAQNQENIQVSATVYQYDGKLDYWTSGLFGQVAAQYNDLCTRAVTAEEEMDIAGMNEILDQLDRTGIQLTECVEFAQQEFQLFGMVQNLATRIYGAMTQDRAWSLVESGFADNDARGSFQMTYRDGAGNMASFVLIPNRGINEMGQPGEIQFFLDVSDGIKTENRDRCAILRRGILSRLEGARIDIGENVRPEAHTVSASKDAFLASATSRGGRIKDDRVEYARSRMLQTNN